MTKVSTPILRNHQTEEDVTEAKAKNLGLDFADVLNKLSHEKLEAPQKSVNFIINFSKAFRRIPIKDSPLTEMLIN